MGLQTLWVYLQYTDDSAQPLCLSFMVRSLGIHCLLAWVSGGKIEPQLERADRVGPQTSSALEGKAIILEPETRAP